MKRNLLLSLYALCLLIFGTSCDALENALEKDFDINNTIPITITGATGQQISAIVEEVNFNDDEIKEHSDKIKDLTIDGITFKVTQFTPTPNNAVKPILNGQLEFAETGSNTFKKISTISNLDLAAEFATPPASPTSLPLEAANQASLMEMIKGGKTVQFRMTGTTSSSFVSASIDFKISSTLTVGL